VGAARTSLSFTGDHDVQVGLQELSAVARIEFMVRPGLTLFAGGGPILGGTVQAEGTDYHMRTGWLATAGVSWLALTETPGRPFVIASFVLGYAATHTAVDSAGPTASWRAGDGRIGVAVGKSFGRLRPYAVGRVFGGPVHWELAGQSINGTDTHHYQLGAGAALSLPAHIDLELEAIPLGEQALVLGAGFAF
jgi:hypothetical protein